MYTKVLTPINVDNDNQDTNDEDDKVATPEETSEIQKLLDDDEQPENRSIWGDVSLPPQGTDPRA